MLWYWRCFCYILFAKLFKCACTYMYICRTYQINLLPEHKNVYTWQLLYSHFEVLDCFCNTCTVFNCIYQSFFLFIKEPYIWLYDTIPVNALRMYCLQPTQSFLNPISIVNPIRINPEVSEQDLLIVATSTGEPEVIIDHTMAESECGRHKTIPDRWNDLYVISGKIRDRSLRIQVEKIHDVWTEDSGKIATVGDMLRLRNHYSSGFLEKLFVVPVRVFGLEFLCGTVVFSQENDVHRHQSWLLISPTIT